MFRARWTERIHEEWTRSLLEAANRPNPREARTHAAVDGCRGARLPHLRYEDLIDGLELPDPDDRQVLAATIRGRVDVIVMLNLKDFPPERRSPFGIEAHYPDVFIDHQLSLNQSD
ncbi:hypothetical protein GobsT_49680 [Gemmata obscuriglobus]|nr:hypothetical protein GobsT_49680 [Gemmata obscuriglobus]VTS09487.1 Uncharacterized protein OS=Pseudomonas sp. GM25 GN=PMI24_05252 PE=4 SV=1: PIN_3 [Gemmata obscuriglobus UQM 2246]